jgi:hypothetical protein
MLTTEAPLGEPRGRRLSSGLPLGDCGTLDEACHFGGLRDQGDVARAESDDFGAHSFCEHALEVWVDGLIVERDLIVARDGLPPGFAGLGGQDAERDRMLHGGQYLGVARRDVRGEVVDEGAGLDARVSLVIHGDVRDGRGGWIR